MPGGLLDWSTIFQQKFLTLIHPYDGTRHRPAFVVVVMVPHFWTSPKNPWAACAGSLFANPRPIRGRSDQERHLS